jgi:hypothetical protein
MNDKGNKAMGILMNDASSPKEIGSALYDKMGEWGWLTSYNYKKREPKQFLSNTLPNDLKTEMGFTKNMFYLANLYMNEGEDFELTKREYNRYNWDKSIICAYCSVLFYLLNKSDHKESGILGKRKMKYVQGFYRHPLREEVPDMFAMLLGGKTQMGIHAFVTIDDIVFDFTIAQQRHAFNIEKPYVAGDIPNGMEYFGYEESLTVVDEYWKMFAKEEGLTPKGWLLHHELNSLKLLEKHMVKSMEEKK